MILALLLPLAALMSEPECPITSRYCVAVADAPDAEALVTITRRDGMVVRKLAATDIFTENDAQSLRMYRFSVAPLYRGETLVLPVPTDKRDAPFEEIRIDLATGRVTRPEHDIYPAPRVWTKAAEAAPPSKERPQCLTPDVVLISSDELFARATERPLPKYPLLGLKVRLEGMTRIEVVVSETGDVLCARVAKPLPFGIDTAALAAAREWKFEPSPTKVMGSIEFHFRRVPWDFVP